MAAQITLEQRLARAVAPHPGEEPPHTTSADCLVLERLTGYRAAIGIR
jgi:hypothetical protein